MGGLHGFWVFGKGNEKYLELVQDANGLFLVHIAEEQRLLLIIDQLFLTADKHAFIFRAL